MKIKAIAVALGGENWRQYVKPLPPGMDVNHLGDRNDNRACKLEMQTEGANRGKREMTDEEWEKVRTEFA